jgi:molecular chaperone DnaJ
MFGFGGGQSRSQQRTSGHDIQTDVTIDFLEAAFGIKKELSFSRLGTCPECKGNGAEPGTPIKTCDTCHGQGAVMRVQQTILGAMQTRVTCSACRGEGKIAEKPCHACSGKGVHQEKVTVTVDVPAGINHGETLRLSHQGEAGVRGATAGDLYVTVHVREHDVFERDGADIHSQATISYAQAVLGAKIAVMTIDGEGTLTIPEGTHSGTVFKLRGKGVPDLHGRGHGDQYVTVTIDVPKKVSRRQKELLEALEKESK